MTLAMDLLNTHMSVPTSSHATVLSMPTALSARLADSLAHATALSPLSLRVYRPQRSRTSNLYTAIRPNLRSPKPYSRHARTLV